MTRAAADQDESTWTEVRYKKPGRHQDTDAKDPPDPHEAPPHDTIPTTTYRAEFAIAKKTSSFHPVHAMTALYAVLQQACPELLLYSCDRYTKFEHSEKIPTASQSFNTHFNVTPHLYPAGGGHIHVHFCLSSTINMDTIRQIPEVFNHLKQQSIWITPHQYETYKLTTVGILLHKSPTITFRPTYQADIKHTLEEFNALTPPERTNTCLLYTSPSPRDGATSRMPSSA